MQKPDRECQEGRSLVVAQKDKRIGPITAMTHISRDNSRS